MSKRNYLLLSFIVLLLSCNKDKIVGTPSGSTTPIPTPTTQVGVFTIEPTKEIISKEITTNGGIVAVENTKTDLDGLKIEVPAQAYATPVTFKISASKIVKNELGADINIISPLIEIDNGGEYANDIMTLTIPIKLPQGHFASAFMYNRDNGEMEVLPILSLESDKIVVATTHFNSSNVVKNGRVGDLKKGSIVVNSIDEKTQKLLFELDYDTGFKVGEDDWEFPNYGSYITAEGNCTGITLSEVYYFLNLKQANDKLWANKSFDRFTVKANEECYKQDDLGYDNREGIRLVSIIQKEAETFIKKERDNVLSANRKSGLSKAEIDKKQFLSIAYYYYIHKIRQKIASPILWVMDVQNQINHAVLCTGISKGSIKLADPNKPGSSCTSFKFIDGKGFDDYEIIEKYNDNTRRKYSPLTYIPISNSINDFIAKQFEAKNKGILADNLMVRDKPRLKANNSFIENNMSVFPPFVIISNISNTEITKFSTKGDAFKDGEYGIQTIGIYSYEKKTKKWVDFQWFDINVEKLEIKSTTEEPITKAGTIEKEYTFIADGTYKPTPKSIYTWDFGDGSKAVKVTGNNQIKYTYKAKGTYTITITLADEKGELTKITRQIIIKDELPSIPNDLSKIANSEFITYLKSKGMVINEGNNPPAIDGIYTVNANEFVNYLNLPNEKIEDATKTFKSYTFQFSNYQAQNKTVDVSSFRNPEILYTSGESIVPFENSFVIGSGNKFTVFSNQQVRLNVSSGWFESDISLTTTSIYSGELTANGINNFMQAFVINSRRNDDKYKALSENTGRITKDKDGFSEKIKSFPSGHYPNLMYMYLWRH